MPPGQHEAAEFPTLSIGPTPLIDLGNWSLSIASNDQVLAQLTWDALTALENDDWVSDIHCVTRWSKFDTNWRGIPIDMLLRGIGLADPPAYASAISSDGYSTNITTADLINGGAMIATHYEGEPIGRHHGGPARLLLPKLYFWKSAKWITQLNFSAIEVPGFWETRGYHVYGDPWREQRFDGE